MRAPAPAYFRRLLPHCCLGFLAAGLAVVHAWVAMSPGIARGANMSGLWLVTAALAGIFLQLAWGLGLRTIGRVDRASARKVHFRLMAMIAVLSIAHIVINRA